MDDSPERERVAVLMLVLALIVALCVTSGCQSPGLGTTAASFMRRVRESKDPNIRHAAIARLGSPQCYDNEAQKAEAARLLRQRLESGDEPIATRAVICRTLGALGGPDAREALLKAAADDEGVVRLEACRALGKAGLPEDATVLARTALVDNLEDCRIAALDALGELKPDDPRIEGLLVQAMEHPDPAIRYAAVNALRKLNGKDLGVEVDAWRKNLQAKAPPAPTSTPTGPATDAAVQTASSPAATPPPPAPAPPAPAPAMATGR